MAGPTLAERFKYHTASDAQRQLGLSREEFDRRMKQGILPAPTVVNQHGVRLFDDKWLEKARGIIDRQR